jgi:hypothetical protein
MDLGIGVIESVSNKKNAQDVGLLGTMQHHVIYHQLKRIKAKADATQNLSGESYLAKVQDMMSSIMSEQYSAEKNANENVYAFNDSTCFSIAESGEGVCSSGLADIDACNSKIGNADPICDSQINTMEPKPMQKSAPKNHIGNQSNSDQQALKMVMMEQSFKLEQAREKE